VVAVAGLGVAEQVPDDDQDGGGDGFMALALPRQRTIRACRSPRKVAEEGGGAGGAGGGLADEAAQPGVALAFLAGAGAGPGLACPGHSRPGHQVAAVGNLPRCLRTANQLDMEASSIKITRLDISCYSLFGIS